jgi:hypothetical protein
MAGGVLSIIGVGLTLGIYFRLVGVQEVDILYNLLARNVIDFSFHFA